MPCSVHTLTSIKCTHSIRRAERTFACKSNKIASGKIGIFMFYFQNVDISLQKLSTMNSIWVQKYTYQMSVSGNFEMSSCHNGWNTTKTDTDFLTVISSNLDNHPKNFQNNNIPNESYRTACLIFIRQLSLYFLVDEVLRRSEIMPDEKKNWHFIIFLFFSSDMPKKSNDFFSKTA